MLNYVQEARRWLVISIPSLADTPELLDLYALLVLAKGEQTSLEDVHDAWAVWRNRSKPDHKSLIPFDQLTPDVQELDRPYMDAIKTAARVLDEIECAS